MVCSDTLQVVFDPLLGDVSRQVQTGKGMYNGYILTLPPRIIDDVEKRKIEKRGLSSLKRRSLSNNLFHHLFKDVSLLEIRLKNNPL
jgi:hypothetical protein